MFNSWNVLRGSPSERSFLVMIPLREEIVQLRNRIKKPPTVPYTYALEPLDRCTSPAHTSIVPKMTGMRERYTRTGSTLPWMRYSRTQVNTGMVQRNIYDSQCNTSKTWSNARLLYFRLELEVTMFVIKITLTRSSIFISLALIGRYLKNPGATYFMMVE